LISTTMKVGLPPSKGQQSQKKTQTLLRQLLKKSVKSEMGKRELLLSNNLDQGKVRSQLKKNHRS